MELIIATKNNSKYASIKSLVLKILGDKKIHVDQIDPGILSAREIGKSSRENCLIKINHYKKYLKSPFIVCDDDIYFIGAKDKLNLTHKFHELGGKTDKSPKEISKFIQSYLLKAKKVKMIRTRYYGLVKGSHYKIFVDKFTAILKPLSKTSFNSLLNDNVLDNPLNHFIIPNKQKKRHLVYNTQEKIGNFIKNL